MEIDLYNAFSKSFSGAVDNSDGVGLPRPASLLSTWKQTSYPPNGWGPNSEGRVRGCWVYNGYAYFCVQSPTGTGPGVYRYQLAGTDPVTMTYDSMVSISSILTGANTFSIRSHGAFHDGNGTVVIVGTNSGVGFFANVIGQWDCSNWPFTTGNADWISTLGLQRGSYSSTASVNDPCCALGASNLYVSSQYAGQIHTVSLANGTYTGPWVVRASYGTTNAVYVLGEDNAGKPFAGGYYVPNRNMSLWNISNPASWSEDTIIWPSALASYATPNHHFQRTTRQFFQTGYYEQVYGEITRYELNLLGFPTTTLGCWAGWRMTKNLLLQNSSEYRELILPTCTYTRHFPKGPLINQCHRIVEINDMPYLLGANNETQDHEEEDPGGDVGNFYGVSACPVGPGKVTYSATISQSTAGIPTRAFMTVPVANDNYCRSEHYSKHRLRVRIDSGDWTDWRSGDQELNNLQVSVGGKDTWPEFVPSSYIEIEHELSSGWPYTWETVRGNPGESGDPDTPNVSVSDVGPPRHVRLFLSVDPREFGGGLL